MAELTLQGDFGAIVYRDSDSGRYINIPTEVALTFFQKLAIQKPNIVLNTLGLYTHAKVGADGKARFANLTVPRHLLQSRKNGCGWNPKGNMVMETDVIETYAVEYNGEQCPDFLWDGCLDMLSGAGNEARDLFSNPEKRAVMASVIDRTYLGLGNSFYDLVNFGKHPVIALSDAGGWYNEEDNAWDDFVEQQDILSGHLTICDSLKSTGRTNFNVIINNSDVSSGKFIGSAKDLFDSLIAAQGPELRIMIKQATAQGMNRPMILVDPSIFNKYRDEIINDFSNIPDTYTLFLQGEDGARFPQRGVLMYDGYWIVSMDEWDLFDELTGTKTYRALLTVPGNFAVAYDVPDLAQFSGMGMRINQRLDAPYQGKVFMDTTFKVGTGLIDPKLMAYAALTVTP